jgi:Rapamycin-insensitive companion of mTOR RasGEF_N domain
MAGCKTLALNVLSIVRHCTTSHSTTSTSLNIRYTMMCFLAQHLFQNSRLYATSFLRVMLRAVPSVDFSQWGLKLLVQQLEDSHKPVAMLALSLLSEACEDPVSWFRFEKFIYPAYFL